MRAIAAWPDCLETVLRERCQVFREVRVLAETASTQDVARELADRAGLVVTAARQTHGRGRHGRTWTDTADAGIAVTFIAPDAPLERLVLASAVACVEAIGAVGGPPVGIKWPNDIVTAMGRKLAGVLIERVGAHGGPVALIGIGINVTQAAFPDALASTATSLRIEGAEVDRLDLLAALLAAVDASLRQPTESLVERYQRHDALRGAFARFATPGGEVAGRVREAHPLEGIRVDVAPGELVTLPLATTSVLSWLTPSGVSVDKRQHPTGARPARPDEAR